MSSKKFVKRNEYDQEETDEPRLSDEEQERFSGEELDGEENEERENLQELNEEREEIKQTAEATQKKMENTTKKIADAINGPVSTSQLKVKKITARFAGSLKGIRKSEMDKVSQPLGENFKEADGSYHIGQVKKITCTSAIHTFPVTVGVTITGDKIPPPTVEIADAPHMKAHMILTPKQTKLPQKEEVLFEQKLLTENKALSEENENFSKEYAQVSATNAHLIGAVDTGKVTLCTEQSPVLKWYLAHRINRVGGKTTPKGLKKEEMNQDPTCYYDRKMDKYVMDNVVFKASLAQLTNRIDFGNSVSFKNLAVQLDRMILSDAPKGNPWIDHEEVSHHATPKTIDSHLDAPQSCYLTFKIEYL